MILISFIFLSITLLSTGNFLLAQKTTSKTKSGEILAYYYQPMQQGIHQIYVIDEDGKYLFFTVDHNIYWVDAKIIEKLKPKEFK